MAPLPERAPADAARLREALILSGLLSLALLLFYVLLFPMEGIHVPAWSDAQTYIWWSRRAGALGLSAFGTGTRPATVGLLAALSPITHVPGEAIVEAIGPVLAAAVGLAAAALSESVLGSHRGRFVLTAVLTGTFLSQLVTSFFATLAFGAMFVAALVYCSEALEGRRATPFVAGGVLFGAAALAHPVFGGFEAVLVIGGLAALALRARRSPAGDGGGSLRDDGRGARWASMVAIAAVVLVLGLVVGRSASGPPLDTSADAVLRRLGPGSLLRKSFRDTLFAYLPIFMYTAAAAALALTLVPKRHWASTAARQRMFGGVVVVWLAVTVGAIPLLLVGLATPAQRLIALCLPLPLLVAMGLASAGAGRERRRGKIVAVVLLMAGAAFLVPRYWVAWNGQRANSPQAVAASRTIGSVLARQPAGTPLVLVANDLREGPSFFHITRLASYLRDGVPPARVPDVHVFVGTVQDFVEGRPTLTGKVGRDRMAIDYWNRIRAVLDRPALAVAVASFDPVAYQDALAMPGRVAIVPGVVALRGFTGATAAPQPASSALTSAGAGPLSPWLPVWLAPLLLIVLGAVGWPWAAATLPGANPRIHAALAPAVGIAALSLVAIVADAVGLPLDGAGGHVAFAVSLGAGLVALGLSRRGRREVAPPDRPSRVRSHVGS